MSRANALASVLRAHGMAAIFDDDGFLVILLHVRQRLGQDAGLVERADVWRVGHEAGLVVREVGPVSIRLAGRAQSVLVRAHGWQDVQPRRGHAAATASTSQLTISSVPPVGAAIGNSAVAGILPQRQVAGEQRGGDDEAERRPRCPIPTWMTRALRQRNGREHGGGVKQQHR